MRFHGENAYKHTFVVRRQPLGCGESRDVREENFGGEEDLSDVRNDVLNGDIHGENIYNLQLPVRLP